jgi:hypothetical protein
MTLHLKILDQHDKIKVKVMQTQREDGDLSLTRSLPGAKFGYYHVPDGATQIL